MEIKMARELNIRLNTEIKTPLYRQIYAFIRDEIRSGSLEADERLPSTRSLAAGLHVARSTAELAYSQLLSEGYIRAKKNSGYFVNGIENLSGLNFESAGSDPDGSGTGIAAGAGVLQDTVSALTRLGKYVDSGQNSSMIDFSLRHTEMSVFPYSTWKRIMREVMVDANSEMFSHSEPGGDRSLRVTIAHYLHFSRGVRCIPEQVIVGAGNDYLLMLLRHILGENRKVAMENPSYQRAARIFHSFGYRLCPVLMDHDGMVPDSVAGSGADLVYAMPAHQFPVGSVMPVARRAALLGWAMEDSDRYIIEDDYDSEFRYRGKPIPALQSPDPLRDQALIESPETEQKGRCTGLGLCRAGIFCSCIPAAGVVRKKIVRHTVDDDPLVHCPARQFLFNLYRRQPRPGHVLQEGSPRDSFQDKMKARSRPADPETVAQGP